MIKNIFKKLILIGFIFLLAVPTFAEEEASVDIDIYKNYEGWYKNFIVECGAVRVTLRDYSANTLADYYVLPTQFESKKDLQRKLNWEGITNQKDSENREILFIQKNEGKLNLDDYGYNGLDRKYSDNIPQLTKLHTEGSFENFPYVYFEAFSEYKTVDEWKLYNNGENVNKLATDLGLDSIVASLNTSNLPFYQWVTTPNADGFTPSLELQPVNLYPESTEQIYCNDFYTARSFGMQWNSDCGAYFDEMEKMGKYDTFIIGAILKAADFIRLKLLAGKGKLLVYYDCGVMVTTIVVDEEINNYAEEVHGDHAEASRFSNADRIITSDIETPKYVNLTYTETTKYRHPWNENGFWKNKQKVDHSKYYTKNEIESFYISQIIRVNEEQGLTFENKSNTWKKQEWYDYFNKWKDKDDSSKLIYYISFDSYCEQENWQESTSGEHRGEWRRGEIKYNEWWDPIGIWAGIGDSTLIKTDHNKYTTIIQLIDSAKKTLDLLCTQESFNCSTLPKYGAGVILDGGVATASQILIKFNANLEQIGGSPMEIDEEYNLIVSTLFYIQDSQFSI